MLGLMTIAILLMRTRLPPRSKMPAGNAPPVPPIKDLLMDAKYMITTIGAFFNVMGIFVPSKYSDTRMVQYVSDMILVFYLQTFAIVHGVDHNLAFYSITILNGASVVSIHSTTPQTYH